MIPLKQLLTNYLKKNWHNFYKTASQKKKTFIKLEKTIKILIIFSLFITIFKIVC